MLLNMTAQPADDRVVEVTVVVKNCNVTMYWRRWYHRGSARRQGEVTRIVRATTPLPPTDEDLTRYAQVLAYMMIDPGKRHIRPPQFVRWQEVGLGGDETHPHGQGVDGIDIVQPPLPLFDGSTTTRIGSTISSRLGRKSAAPPKAARSTAREPKTRNMTTRRRTEVDGA